MECARKSIPLQGNERFAPTGPLAYSRRTWLARASPHRRATRLRKHAPLTGRPTATGREDDLMDERDLQSLVTDVRAGRLTRRDFTGMMVGLGLTAPLAAQTFTPAAVAAQPKPAPF